MRMFKFLLLGMVVLKLENEEGGKVAILAASLSHLFHHDIVRSDWLS